MSRGYGHWEQALIRAAGEVDPVTVDEVMRRYKSAPTRSDKAAVHRAAKTLALKRAVVAVYVNACPKCLRVQDHEPEPCCGAVRAFLAVRLPDRPLPHLARPPSGDRCPAWITVSAAARSPVLVGQVVMAGAADVSRLMLRECHARLAAAPQALSLHELYQMAAVVRTAWLIERDSAIAREVTRAVDVVNDGWMDAMDTLQRQVRRQRAERDAAVAERDAAVAARDRAGAERDAARRRVEQLEERIMRDLFRTADEAGMSGLPVLSGTPHV